LFPSVRFGSVATGVVDTGGKFAGSVIDTGGNLPPPSLIPVSTTQGELVAKSAYFCHSRLFYILLNSQSDHEEKKIPQPYLPENPPKTSSENGPFVKEDMNT
jgi:hypothetical protein